MTATMTGNGHVPTGERVRQVLEEHDGNVSATEIGRLLNIPRETAGYHKRKIVAGSGELAVGFEPADPPPAANGVAPPAGAHRPGKSSAGAVRLPRRGRQQRDPIKIAATAVVLAVGLAVSYSHIVHLALLAGAGWWAWVMPLPLDAMALVSLLHLATERRYLIAWAGVLVGAVGSLAANVLAVDPALADMRYVLWGFAALPPIAVIVCGHLLDRGARR